MQSRLYSVRSFRDRSDAGRRLGERIAERQLNEDPIVLGLPRGGVPVAKEVASALGAPVDVLIVRKLGAPFNRELAVGSIASGGVTIYNRPLLNQLGLDEHDLEPILAHEQLELERREQVYRGNRPAQDLHGKTVVLVDDGAATGASMYAAVAAVKAQAPERVIVALPTSSQEAAEWLASVADEVIVLSTPDPFYSVGTWYADFGEVSDEDVTDCLMPGDPA
jgi:putative phosphoribosyl transferase